MCKNQKKISTKEICPSDKLAKQSYFVLESLIYILSSLQFHNQLKYLTHELPEDKQLSLVNNNLNKPKQPDLEIDIGKQKTDTKGFNFNQLLLNSNDIGNAGGNSYQPPQAIFSNPNEANFNDKDNSGDQNQLNENEQGSNKGNEITGVEDTSLGFKAIINEFEKQEGEAQESEDNLPEKNQHKQDSNDQDKQADNNLNNNQDSLIEDNPSTDTNTVNSKLQSRSEQLRAKFQAEHEQRVGRIIKATKARITEVNNEAVVEREAVNSEVQQEQTEQGEKKQQNPNNSNLQENDQTNNFKQTEAYKNENKENLEKLQSELLKNILEVRGLSESELYTSDKEKLLQDVLESQKVENLTELNTKLTSGETTLESINTTFKTHSDLESIKDSNLSAEQKVNSLVEYLSNNSNLPEGINIEQILDKAGYSESWLPHLSETQLNKVFDSIKNQTTAVVQQQATVNVHTDYLTSTINNLSDKDADRLALQLKYSDKQSLVEYIQTYKEIRDVEKLGELVEKVKGEVEEKEAITNNENKLTESERQQQIDTKVQELIKARRLNAERQQQIDTKVQELIKAKGLNADKLFQSEKQQLLEEAQRSVDNPQEYERERLELVERDKVAQQEEIARRLAGEFDNLKTRKESSTEYTKRFVETLGDLTENQKIEFEKLTKVNPERIVRGETTFGKEYFNVNHRVPPGILSSNEVAKILDLVKIENVNSPPLMDILTSKANQETHNNMWQRAVKTARKENLRNDLAEELTTRQILEIWYTIEKNVGYSYELPNAINLKDFI